MKWTIRQLRDYPEDIVRFEHSLDIKEALIERQPQIIDVESVVINGYFVPSKEEVLLHGTIRTQLTLPSTRTLAPVSLMLEIPIKERYVYEDDEGDIETYEETTILLEYDYIDLAIASADVIALNLPIKVLAPEEEGSELPSGSYWSVVTEDEYERKQSEERADAVNPSFAALKTLLNNNDEE